MTNDDLPKPDDGLIESRQRSTFTDRVVGRECEWCGAWMTYTGIGRQPRFCSPAHRQRAYEIRSAESRRDRDREAGQLREEPVRELVERTETVTRTVVRHALPWTSGPLRTPTNAAEWARTVATLCQLVPRGHLQTQPEWPELEAAIRQLHALLEANPARTSVPPARTPELSEADDYVLQEPRKVVSSAPRNQPKRPRKRRR